MTTIKISSNSNRHFEINNEISTSNITFITIQNKSVIVHVCFVCFIVCLYICVCECLLQHSNHKIKHKNITTSNPQAYVRGPLRECRSIRSGASGLPYYCALLVCISVVIELLAVWRYNKPNQTMCRTSSVTGLDFHPVGLVRFERPYRCQSQCCFRRGPAVFPLCIFFSPIHTGHFMGLSHCMFS